MVVDWDASSDSDSLPRRAVAEDVEGTAYREVITSADGFTRGAGGRVKFNKDTKKRRRENAEMDDVEMGDETTGKAVGTTPPKKRKAEQRLGHEFKAKVSGLLSQVGAVG